MRVLYIANGNGLSDSIGGSLKRSIEVSRRLLLKGHEVRFLTTAGGYRACLRERLGAAFEIARCSLLKNRETSVFDRLVAYVLSSLTSIIRLSVIPRCDIAYTDSDFFCDVIPAIYVKLVRKSLWVAMSHHLVLPSHHRNAMMGIFAFGLQRISLGLIARIADRVFVYDSPSGHAIELSLRQYGLSDRRIGRVNNGVDIREIDNVKPQRVPAGVVNIGAVRPSKGLYDVVSVWKIVADKLPAQTLTIVGNMTAENHRYLMSAVEMAGLKSKIIVMGPQDHTSSLRILKEGRVYVSLSHEEGWGTSVCEALAAGLPVVAYDVPTIRYLFGDVVDLVPVGDFNAFAQKVMDVLSNNDKPTAKLRNAACAYSWDDVAEQDLKQMIDAMDESRRSS